MSESGPTKSVFGRQAMRRAQAGMATWQGRVNTWWAGGREKTETFNFQELVRRENAWFAQRDAVLDVARKTKTASQPPELEVSAPETLEPWVAWTPHDRFGLALSGGGVRSATFNLGLLQALSRRYTRSVDGNVQSRSILDYVDYLATVSGGGYIGGFWSTWLRANTPADGQGSVALPRAFPAVAEGQLSAEAEAREVRYLRERSRFLIPRIGLFQAQTWSGVTAVLGGMVPSLVIAAASLVVAWYFFIGLLQVLFWQATIGAAAIGVVTFLVLWLSERATIKSRSLSGESPRWYPVLSLTLALGTSAAWYQVLQAMGVVAGLDFAEAVVFPQRSAVSDHVLEMVVEARPSSYFAPCAPWLGLAALLLVVLRPLGSRWWSQAAIGALERSAARLTVTALLWAGFAGLWWAALEVGRGHGELSTALGSTVVSGGIFVAFRDWLMQPIKVTRGSELFNRLSTWFRPLLPQLLAYAVLLGMVWSAALFVVTTQRSLGAFAWLAQELHTTSSGLMLFGSATLLVGALLLVDTRRIGLHEFYRSRIEATFLSAARAGGVGTEQTLADLGETAGSAVRPLHLVCATANDLSGDPLPNLYRGGRSVSMSPLAVAIGDSAGVFPLLKLSSALTASAAAFNSQMGSISKTLGPAVAFIMSALGLRLGLWIMHPGARRSRTWLPGWYMFKEMLGQSRACVGTRPEECSDLHLSDGGHFENLALYELIRRHCRYVIVSDCGADPELAFDDLANATRRVREDFGVEIEIDVGPLRPSPAGLAEQHAVVGTIHYDGLRGTDKGILLYFKPTLVGDEPTDVTQYRTRNGRFPHEGTGDQFYDEAQWESYRRLGEHCAAVVFRHVEQRGLNARANVVERLFLDATDRWQRLPLSNQDQRSQLMLERDALLSDIGRDAPPAFRRELFPDVAAALDATDGVHLGVVAGDRGHGPSEMTEAIDVVFYCARIVAWMDRAFQELRLEEYWAHPSQQALMAYFHRFAASPSFRRWWVLCRPLCSNGLRDFVKSRFSIRLAEPRRAGEEVATASAHLELLEPGALHKLSGFAKQHWGAAIHAPPGAEALGYRLSFPKSPSETREPTLLAGFLVYRWEGASETSVAPGPDQRRKVVWDSPGLFVPPSLMGSGIGSRLLDAAIDHFENLEESERPRKLEVVVTDPGDRMSKAPPVIGQEREHTAELRADPAHCAVRTQTLHFYKSRGFLQERHKHGQVLSKRVRDAPA